MPSITINITRDYAAELFNLIHATPTTEQGQGNYTEARAQVQKALLKAWPEAAEAGSKSDPKEFRLLEINPKQQRALAEGFLALLNAKGCTGLMYANIERLSGPGREIMIPERGSRTGAHRAITVDGCRVWGWVQAHATQKPVPDFDGELDGEPDLLDLVPAPTTQAVEPDFSAMEARERQAELE